MAVASAATAAPSVAAVCVGTGVSATVGVTTAVGATAGRDGVAVSVGCTTSAAGVDEPTGSPPQPTAATATVAEMAANTRNIDLETLDAG